MVNEDKANIYRQIPDINKSLVFLYHQCKTYYSFIVSLFLKSLFCLAALGLVVALRISSWGARTL